MENSPVLVVLNLAAAAAFLIWSVRLVRTGFERAFGGHLRQWLRRSTSNRLAAAATGAGASILLQSSTAVAMLLAGFMSSGAISVAAGLAIILGADLGSAIVVQVLTSPISVLMPLLLLAGVLIFLRSSRRSLRQVGRILIGLALIFMSLDLIRDTSFPLTQSDTARATLAYLSGDPLTAFLLAAVFAWLVHSSVAAVLLFATLAAQGVLPLQAAFAMVLGANLGGAFIAFFLTLQSDVDVRRVILGNLLLRGGGACAAVISLYWLDATALIPGGSAQQQALNVHLGFNGLLLLVGLVVLVPCARLAGLFLPATAGLGADITRSALDPTVKNRPALAFACAQRELVEMANRIEAMLREAMPLFDTFDEPAAERLRVEQREVSRMSLDLRVYLSGIRSTDPNEDTGTRAFDLAGVAVNLEAGADSIARKMVSLARRKNAEKTHFSEDGWRELSDFHDTVLRNVQHGIIVLMSEDIGAARELVGQKEKIREIEERLERNHLTRLRQGLTESIETSAIHIDLLRALKMLNTSFAMIAYPMLKEHGELLESRLANS
ncbi:Na/Pi cotransporter family protein [Arenibacterium halophilum]|uniref:Na/Pi cotransporter family protein n=1 Tax=Arenibacterium halophilum TaxID=2583821 RepID=A0ABY2XC89_9RHOB|nr:Na/Pi cotransporter family protein [Arenibacterium halophilum]TMV14634.1 Na/Pi cotransporter family protein [Arenibacterium halophilum]